MDREKNMKLEHVRNQFCNAIKRTPNSKCEPLARLIMAECDSLALSGVNQLSWNLLALHVGQIVLRRCGLKQPPMITNGAAMNSTATPTTASKDVPPQA